MPLVGERVRWRCVYPQHVRVEVRATSCTVPPLARDCLKCRAWQRTRGPARASVGAVETPFPGVYIQFYYVRDGEHAFLTISPRTRKYEVFQMYEKLNVCIFYSVFEVLCLYSLIY